MYQFIPILTWLPVATDEGKDQNVATDEGKDQNEMWKLNIKMKLE